MIKEGVSIFFELFDDTQFEDEEYAPSGDSPATCLVSLLTTE